MMQRLGVVVIGVGSMGCRHAENVRKFPEMRLVALVDARPEAARAAGEALGCDRWFARADEALALPDCQAAIIATAASTHADLVETAASYGRDVLCEKPLALTVADAERAAAAMERAGRRLQVGFMRRYDPGYAAAQRLIVAGRIGTPRIFKAISRDRESWPSQASGGIFVDSAIHDYDLARWLMTDEISEVSALATAGAPLAGGLDTGLVSLRFAGGGLGAAEVFAHAGYGYDIRTEVVGSAGTVRIGSDAQQPLQLLTADGSQTAFVGHFLDRFATAYELEVRDWARRMLAGEPPAVSAEDGIRALQIALAAHAAAISGHSVRLPSGGVLPAAGR
ncbi:MAG TPA: Gfo/Idh/MocA family oxidoreductase [Chloroflexota bacterium]|jgi:predicted dehydrogenase|nr:Gfo/Idh/MocA family oxidoreductase [Chloroflexota bacterium]